MKITKSNIPWILLVAAILFFSYREWSRARDNDRFIADLSKYTGEVEHLKLENGALIASSNTMVVNSEEQLKSIASSLNDTIAQMIKNFKKVTNVTYVTNNFEAGKDSSSFAKEIPCDFKPFHAMYSDSTYSLYQTIHKDRFVIDTLVVPNKLALVYGRKQVGFLKYEDYVDINNSNPLMVATNVKNYTFTPEKKWHEKRWANALFGVVIYQVARIGINTLTNR